MSDVYVKDSGTITIQSDKNRYCRSGGWDEQEAKENLLVPGEPSVERVDDF